MGQRGFDLIFHRAKLSGVGRVSEPARSTKDICLEGRYDTIPNRTIRFQSNNVLELGLDLKPSSWAFHLAAL